MCFHVKLVFMKKMIKNDKNRKLNIIPIQHILLIIWLCIIWGHSMQPAAVSSSESGTILSIINAITQPLGIEFSEYFIRKLAHFTEFTICGILISNSMFSVILSKDTDRIARKLHLICSLFFGLLVAMTDETIQLFTFGRSCEVKDVWLDFSGVCLGIIIFVLKTPTSISNK